MVKPNVATGMRKVKQAINYMTYSRDGRKSNMVKKVKSSNAIKERKKSGKTVVLEENVLPIVEVHAAFSECNKVKPTKENKKSVNASQLDEQSGNKNNTEISQDGVNRETAGLSSESLNEFKKAFDSLQAQSVGTPRRDNMSLETKKQELREQISKLKADQQELEDEEYLELMKEKKELEKRLKSASKKGKSSSKEEILDLKLINHQTAVEKLIGMQGLAGLKLDEDLLKNMKELDVGVEGGGKAPFKQVYKQLNNILGQKSKTKARRKKSKAKGRRKSKRDYSSSEDSSSSSSSSDESTESSSESESEESTDEERRRRRRKKKGKIQSGLFEKRGSSKLVSHEVYAHAALDEGASEVKKLSDLSFNLLVAGELETILHTKTGSKERNTRLKLLRILAYKYEHLSLKEILEQYASFISKVEKGKFSWGSEANLEKFEQQLVYRISVENKVKKEQRSDYRVESRKKVEKKKFYCADFNRGKCTNDSPHEAKINGNTVMVYHLCKRCLLDENVEKYHADKDCAARK